MSTLKSSNHVTRHLFNICLVVISVVHIIHNEKVKRDIDNYRMQEAQPYKIRHIIIDHFRTIYLEQHLKFWMQHVNCHFVNRVDCNTTITIPEAIQQFYTFFNDYKNDVRGYFDQQFVDLPREERKLIKAETLKYIDGLSDQDRVQVSKLHKCWEMETEVDHATEDQLESIYDALDSVNVVADVNFYSFLKKYEDPNDMEKKVITPWQIGFFLSSLNEGLIQHVEKESNYDVAAAYEKKLQQRHNKLVDRVLQLNATYGNFFNSTKTTTAETIMTLV